MQIHGQSMFKNMPVLDLFTKVGVYDFETGNSQLWTVYVCSNGL